MGGFCRAFEIGNFQFFGEKFYLQEREIKINITWAGPLGIWVKLLNFIDSSTTELTNNKKLHYFFNKFIINFDLFFFSIIPKTPIILF